MYSQHEDNIDVKLVLIITVYILYAKSNNSVIDGLQQYMHVLVISYHLTLYSTTKQCALFLIQLTQIPQASRAWRDYGLSKVVDVLLWIDLQIFRRKPPILLCYH